MNIIKPLWNGSHWICQETYDAYYDKELTDKVNFPKSKDKETTTSTVNLK